MSQAVETFKEISWLIFKWLLTAVGAIAGLAILLIAGTYGWNWYTHDRHAENVQFIISTQKKDCEDDRWPIHIIIGNSSGKTIEKVSFSLAAFRPGRTSDISKYNSYDDDHEIEPGKGYGGCWLAPELAEGSPDPRELRWSVKYKTIHFRE